jgi:hypothetical protein
MRAGETYEIICDICDDKYTIEIVSIECNGVIHAYYTCDKYPIPSKGVFCLDSIRYMKYIEPPYKWPAGVSKGAYMAMDADGKWHIFNEKPQLNDSSSLTDWTYIKGSFVYPISALGYKNPPTPSDWKQSLIKNV